MSEPERILAMVRDTRYMSYQFCSEAEQMALLAQSLQSQLAAANAERDKYRLALDRAAYALFQIKRIQPDQIAEFAERSHAEACAVLDTLSTNKQEGE